MNEERLYNLKLKLLKLLTQDAYIKKEKFKTKKVNINGKLVTEKEYDGIRVIHCKTSDWKKADKLHRGNSARERLRILMKEIRDISKEIRKITLEMDKEAREMNKKREN